MPPPPPHNAVVLGPPTFGFAPFWGPSPDVGRFAPCPPINGFLLNEVVSPPPPIGVSFGAFPATNGPMRAQRGCGFREGGVFEGVAWTAWVNGGGVAWEGGAWFRGVILDWGRGLGSVGQRCGRGLGEGGVV